MHRRARYARPAWEDRFAMPSREDLLEAFGRQQRHLIDLMSERLLSLESVEESLSWRGIPWRWTLAYCMEGETDRPWAYLVPRPGKPLFAMPIMSDTIDLLDARKLSRVLRDGLAAAVNVAGVRWPQWELTGKPLTEELLALAKRRHDALLATA